MKHTPLLATSSLIDACSQSTVKVQPKSAGITFLAVLFLVGVGGVVLYGLLQLLA